MHKFILRKSQSRIFSFTYLCETHINKTCNWLQRAFSSAYNLAVLELTFATLSVVLLQLVGNWFNSKPLGKSGTMEVV